MVSRYVQPWHRNVHIITLEHFQPLLAPFRPQLPSFRLDMQVEVSWSRSQDNTTQEMLRKKKCPHKITLDRQRTQPACLPRPLRIEETGKRSEGSLQQAMLLDTTHSCARLPHVARHLGASLDHVFHTSARRPPRIRLPGYAGLFARFSSRKRLRSERKEDVERLVKKTEPREDIVQREFGDLLPFPYSPYGAWESRGKRVPACPNASLPLPDLRIRGAGACHRGGDRDTKACGNMALGWADGNANVPRPIRKPGKPHKKPQAFKPHYDAPSSKPRVQANGWFLRPE
ncbi:hypothetical protein CCUS01_17429 [Colletotrichum cuscutae]|uniref:Uncharacterized protein n=1 Tax=Colletotrichum cuscutae TaxID=1209917 RepID=A0AAI9V513_9PEZI|nr:hypothetical protein CCUS01_17429 [Colletotrichum cuscutae]